jgi:ankyrin repeat protein
LVNAGANPQKPAEKGTFAGKNALMWAASQGRTEVVKLLVSKGVDVNYVSQTGSFKVCLFELNLYGFTIRPWLIRVNQL